MRRKCYSDLNEFWVVGDFISKVFMTRDVCSPGCYVNCTDPMRAMRFSTYREALKHMKSDKDAAKWVEEQGGPIFAKPLRCRKSVVVYPPGARP